MSRDRVRRRTRGCTPYSNGSVTRQNEWQNAIVRLDQHSKYLIQKELGRLACKSFAQNIRGPGREDIGKHDSQREMTEKRREQSWIWLVPRVETAQDVGAM